MGVSKFNKTYKLLLINLVLGNICSAQVSEGDFNKTLKMEISAISIMSSTIQSKTDSAGGYKMEVIPLRKCADSFVRFSKREAPAVAIYTKKAATGTIIKNIVFVYVKYLEPIPDSAFAGLQSISFDCIESSRKAKGISNCKVLQSADKQRVYIYMLNGKGASRNEVIWVIKNGKYHSRIINPVPEVKQR